MNEPEQTEDRQDDDEGLVEQGTVSEETKGYPLGHFYDAGIGYMF